MQSATCSSCDATFNKSETFQVLGRTLCGTCGEEFINGLESNTLTQDQVVRNIDPTVCAWCSVDHGDSPLPTSIATLPTCEACDTRMRNWPYPTWIKATFIGLLLIAICSFAYNYRFFDALLCAKKATRAAESGDFALAADLWERAAQDVPDEKGFKDTAQLMRGIAFLQEDRSAEAVKLLEGYVNRNPDDRQAKQFLLSAEIGEAFDTHNYMGMWTLALKLLEANPRNGQFEMMAASSAACVFASSGNQEFADHANVHIKKGGELGLNGPDADEYEDRIRHRLVTREIIDSKEFAQRFPNGWHDGKDTKKP